MDTARLIKNGGADPFHALSAVSVVSTLLVHPKEDKVFPVFATTLVDSDGFELANFSLPIDDMINLSESIKRGVIAGLEKVSKVQGLSIDDPALFSQAKRTLDREIQTNDRLRELLDQCVAKRD